MNDENQPATETEKVILAVEHSAHTAWAKIRQYKTHLIVLCLAVLVFSLIYSAVATLRERTEQAAWKQIFTTDFYAREKKQQTLSAEYEKIMPEIAGANAGFYPYMQMLTVYGVGDKKDNLAIAIKAAETLIKNFPRHPFINQVRFDYATILMNLERYAEALTQYQNIIATGDKAFFNVARLYAGLAAENAGKNNEALDFYTRLTAERNEFSALAEFARLRLETKAK